MDPNAWQAYQAYTNRFNAGGREEHNPYASNTASLFFAHQQLREAASQHYQNQIFPPSLVQAAAANNKSAHQLQQQAALLNTSILSPPVTPWKLNNHESGGSRDEQPRRSVIETKTSQPAFPGQPPPLQDGRHVREAPAFPGQQPPPRQSSQPRASIHSQPAFPGIAPPQSPQYGNNYSPQAPSPQNYHCSSPQDYQREREKERQEQERRIREEERREQERIRREQERLRLEQEHKRREQERIRLEQERLRKEEEEKRRLREEYERKKREEQERRKREELDRQRKEQERIRQEQERLREQERIRVEQERMRLEQERLRQERIKQEQLEQLKLEEQQRDLGLARLGALGALHDLGDSQDMINYNDQAIEHNAFHSTINFHELNMLNSNRQQQLKDEKPVMNSHYNAWLNRANELLDLSSGDGREGQQQQHQQMQQEDGGGGGAFIPQILMNPWDPQQPPVMTLAPIANAMQQYQQQWLSQYQQAAMNMGDDSSSFPLGKCRVLCISPDDDMGFLINLPAPCNLLYQPLPEDGIVRKNVDSPFVVTFHKFLKDPESLNRNTLTEAPDRPPEPTPGQYAASGPTSPEPSAALGKKLYIPPYTPKATKREGEPDNIKVSATGYSRSLVQETNQARKPQPILNRSTGRPSQTGTNNGVVSKPATISHNTSNSKKKITRSRSELSNDRLQESPEPTEQPLLRRESSRRKAKEQSQAKREAQEDLLLDEDDPTLNNPALDLEDSDVDDEWTPLKEKEAGGAGGASGVGGRRKRGDDSSDDEYAELEELARKKRRAAEMDKAPIKRPGTEVNSNLVPEADDFKVGDFLVLKSEAADPRAPIWRVDGKTLIQKYECTDEEGTFYKNVSTYSGWTPTTRHKYDAVPVKVLRQSARETYVEKLSAFPPAAVTPAAAPPAAAKAAAVVKTAPSTASSATPAPANPSAKRKDLEEIRRRSRSETTQFQENFEVYMQALISQCLDSNFLNEIFSEQDEYFVSNIEKVDSVTLLRKDKLLTGVSWTIRFQHALTVWPCLEDLGGEACSATVCGACEKTKAGTMLQMFGQPYHPNTLATVPPDTEAMINRNFSVCSGCAMLCKLYHKLHHQKQKLFVLCSDIVEKRKSDTPGIDTTQILNQLLADDAWLEQQFSKMQDLWGDADCLEK